MSCDKTITLPSGQKMARVGLGTWQSTDEAELESALNAALEAGYRHIDTAYVYENEHIVGRVINQWISSGKVKREDLFVTTKLPLFGVHPDKVEYFMKKSLENLKLDYVDLYLIHFAVYTEYVEGQPFSTMKPAPTDHISTWKKMEEQVDAGRTKNIGLSNFTIAQISKILKSARTPPAILQVELHVYLQQKELVDFCHKNNISVVGYSPLGSPGVNVSRKKRGLKELVLLDILNDPVIVRIANKHKKSKAQILLRFLIQKDIVVIPKSVKAARVKENIDVFDFALDAADVKEVEGLDIGERARIVTFDMFPGIDKHPEYPFGK